MAPLFYKARACTCIHLSPLSAVIQRSGGCHALVMGMTHTDTNGRRIDGRKPERELMKKWYRRGASWFVLGGVVAVVAALHVLVGIALLALVALDAGDNSEAGAWSQQFRAPQRCR